MLRKSYDTLDLAASDYEHIRDYREWCQFLEVQFQRRGKVNFVKKAETAGQNVSYIDRYLKRPPISASKLRHYSGGAVVRYYYDHRAQQHGKQALSHGEVITANVIGQVE